MNRKDKLEKAYELLSRGALPDSIALELGMSVAWVRKYLPATPHITELAAKRIMSIKTPERAVEALKDLHIESERDFKYLVKHLKDICANMTEGALERSETFKRFSTMANELAQSVTLRSDETELKAVMVLNTVANASIDPVLKLLALTKNITDNPAFNEVKSDSDLLPLISIDPLEASKEYQRLLNGG